MITPHGPDPVFYGIRGENAESLVTASKIVKANEKLDGYMVFKSNQGTSDHLKNELDVNDLRPYTSGFLVGQVCSNPIMMQGGHVFFSIRVKDKKIKCGIYKPTKITTIAQNLILNDKIRIGGGIRKASKNHESIVNVEFLDVMELAKDIRVSNPSCKKCSKKMKSKGSKQGFECTKCGNRSHAKSTSEIPRKIQCKLYLPVMSAHRHLTRPYQRIEKRNKQIRFDTSTPWFCVY